MLAMPISGRMKISMWICLKMSNSMPGREEIAVDNPNVIIGVPMPLEYGLGELCAESSLFLRRDQNGSLDGILAAHVDEFLNNSASSKSESKGDKAEVRQAEEETCSRSVIGKRHSLKLDLCFRLHCNMLQIRTCTCMK